MKSFLGVLLLVTLTACGDAQKPVAQTPAINLPAIDNTSDLGTPDVVEVLTAFVRECPGLARFGDDLGGATFGNGHTIHSENRTRGWTKKYELTFKVSDKPVNRELVDARAMGHTCYYEFGGGSSPGFVAIKTPCAQLCGMPEPGYKHAAEMGDLDHPSSEAYKQRRATMEQEYRSYLAKYEKQARGGDYQAQRNLAYTYANDSFDRSDRVTGCAWRLYIAKASRKATEADMGNLKSDCSRLTDDEKRQAEKQAFVLLESVKK